MISFYLTWAAAWPFKSAAGGFWPGIFIINRMEKQWDSLII
jgi:hypothetical protein